MQNLYDFKMFNVFQDESEKGVTLLLKVTKSQQCMTVMATLRRSVYQ